MVLCFNWHSVCRGSVLLEKVNIILKPPPPRIFSLCYLWLEAVSHYSPALPCQKDMAWVPITAFDNIYQKCFWPSICSAQSIGIFDRWYKCDYAVQLWVAFSYLLSLLGQPFKKKCLKIEAEPFPTLTLPDAEMRVVRVYRTGWTVSTVVPPDNPGPKS